MIQVLVIMFVLLGLFFCLIIFSYSEQINELEKKLKDKKMTPEERQKEEERTCKHYFRRKEIPDIDRSHVYIQECIYCGKRQF